MFGEYGIDYGPETHGGFSDCEWKIACEMIELLSRFPLPDDAENWDEDDFYNWVERVAFGFDKYSTYKDSLAEAEDALEWLRGLFGEEPQYTPAPFNPYLKIERTSEPPKRSSVYRDENGNLHCRNISAYQIPSISLTV